MMSFNKEMKFVPDSTFHLIFGECHLANMEMSNKNGPLAINNISMGDLRHLRVVIPT